MNAQAVDVAEDDETPEAGPSKQLREFLDVMKGKDKDVLTTSEAVPGDAAYVAKEIEKPARKTGRKGKERSEEEPEAAKGSAAAKDDEDDDAAWLRKRQKALAEDYGPQEIEESIQVCDTLITCRQVYIYFLDY